MCSRCMWKRELFSRDPNSRHCFASENIERSSTDLCHRMVGAAVPFLLISSLHEGWPTVVVVLLETFCSKNRATGDVQECIRLPSSEVSQTCREQQS